MTGELTLFGGIAGAEWELEDVRGQKDVSGETLCH